MNIPPEYFNLVMSALIGAVVTYFVQKLSAKRGVFSYFVTHQRIGVSAADPVFGEVSVSFNGQTIPNLYLSTLELRNESLKDYENVVINIYTDNTKLFSEQTQLMDTPSILEWTEKYKNQLQVTQGDQASEIQLKIYNGQREYIAPVINRGQVVKFTYLNSATSDAQPAIWLSASQKGLRVKFRAIHNEIFGVSQYKAILAMITITVIVSLALSLVTTVSWVATSLAFILGLFAKPLGAKSIHYLMKLRDILFN